MSIVVQKYFEKFHAKIRQSRIEHHSDLIKKRDKLVDELRIFLKEKFKGTEKGIPAFSVFNQGSYSMGTGVIPIERDYDIDVGLCFDFSKDDYDPIEVKSWVNDAFKDKYSVTVKRPCVRVQFTEKGEECYHVDFAIYAGTNWDNRKYLAKGYLNSKDGTEDFSKKWEASDPDGVRNAIKDKFRIEEEKRQAKRIIRYLKRWKDIHFSTDGGTPTGIAITALILECFQPIMTIDAFTKEVTQVNDLEAMRLFIEAVLRKFNSFDNSIHVYLPVAPGNDLFAKMNKSENQLKHFKVKIEVLNKALNSAKNEVAPEKACEILAGILGEDFEIPSLAETAQYKPKAFSRSSESA